MRRARWPHIEISMVRRGGRWPLIEIGNGRGSSALGAHREDRRRGDRAKADLHCTAGCHPTSTSEIDTYPGGISSYLDALRDIIKQDREGARRIVSIGEIGLGECWFGLLEPGHYTL